MEADKAACRQAGMNDHIAKPIDLAAMVATILRVCGRPAETLGAAPLAADIDGAIQRLAGNKRLFAGIARRFISDAAAMQVELEQMLRRDDRAAAGRLLHTWRGLAGTVGLTSVIDAVRRLEADLKQAGGRSVGHADLAALGLLLDAGCVALGAYAAAAIQVQADGKAAISAAGR
jgi:HPt (histidine-containing phosphotransfer) domain-containing protein